MNGTRIEHPDQLVPGAFVTVVGWRKPSSRRVESPYSMFGSGEVPVAQAERRDYFGAVLRVLGVSLPYALVVVRSDPKARPPFPLDLRDAVLAPVSAEFIKALEAWEAQTTPAGHRAKPASAAQDQWAASWRELTANMDRSILNNLVCQDEPTYEPEDDEDDDEEES